MSTANAPSENPGTISPGTFDAMIRRLHLNDNSVAAAAIGEPAEKLALWRDGAEPVPFDVVARTIKLVAIHLQLANDIANQILQIDVPENTVINIGRFKDQAQYDNARNTVLIDDSGKEHPVPFEVYIASLLTAADVLTAAGLRTNFEYYTETQIERFKAARIHNLALADTFTTH